MKFIAIEILGRTPPLTVHVRVDRIEGVMDRGEEGCEVWLSSREAFRTAERFGHLVARIERLD